jgi:hypothetical protein
MTAASFYVPTAGGTFRSTSSTESPWSPDHQHGGPPAALLAHTMAKRNPGAKLITRLTVEFLGPIPQGELTVRAGVLRPGRRIELTEGTLAAGGRPVALARAWAIAAVPESTPQIMPPPSERAIPPIPDPGPQRYFPGTAPGWGYGNAIDWRFVRGGYDQPGPATVWTRTRLPLIAGEEPSALERMIIVADSANGLSTELAFDKWLFVPTCFSLTLHRHLEGEWMLVDAHSRIGAHGIGMAHAELADTRGPLGVITQSLLVAPRGRAAGLGAP